MIGFVWGNRHGENKKTLVVGLVQGTDLFKPSLHVRLMPCLFSPIDMQHLLIRFVCVARPSPTASHVQRPRARERATEAQRRVAAPAEEGKALDRDENAQRSNDSTNDNKKNNDDHLPNVMSPHVLCTDPNRKYSVVLTRLRPRVAFF